MSPQEAGSDAEPIGVGAVSEPQRLMWSRSAPFEARSPTPRVSREATPLIDGAREEGDVVLVPGELPRSRFLNLRHSTASYLLPRGMTLQDVKEQLGHSSIVLTSNTCGHVLEARQREVARAMEAVLAGRGARISRLAVRPTARRQPARPRRSR
jgi:hypothetical protein